MAVGAIAYEELRRNDPTALARVVRTLKAHPQYAARWKPQSDAAPSATRDKLLFMLAAKWPDDVRDEPNYHREFWHYINYTFRFPAQVTGTVLRPDENILTAFRLNRSQLTASGVSEGDRAIALCWLFHLSGDAHQPLHASSLVGSGYPEATGDRGGGLYHVRPAGGGAVTKLHAVWDNMIIDFAEPFDQTEFNAIQDLSADLVRRHPRASIARVAIQDPETWAKESLKLAIAFAYRKGVVKGTLAATNAPKLPANYLSKNHPVAEEQVALAGYRLADLLSAQY